MQPGLSGWVLTQWTNAVSDSFFFLQKKMLQGLARRLLGAKPIVAALLYEVNSFEAAASMRATDLHHCQGISVMLPTLSNSSKASLNSAFSNSANRSMGIFWCKSSSWISLRSKSVTVHFHGFLHSLLLLPLFCLLSSEPSSFTSGVIGSLLQRGQPLDHFSHVCLTLLLASTFFIGSVFTHRQIFSFSCR